MALLAAAPSTGAAGHRDTPVVCHTPFLGTATTPHRSAWIQGAKLPTKPHLPHCNHTTPLTLQTRLTHSDPELMHTARHFPPQGYSGAKGRAVLWTLPGSSVQSGPVWYPAPCAQCIQHCFSLMLLVSAQPCSIHMYRATELTKLGNKGQDSIMGCCWIAPEKHQQEARPLG